MLTCTRRRRPNFLRASLAGSKTQSLQLGMSRPSPESQHPAFRFGRGSSHASTLSMEEIFGDSPAGDRSTGLKQYYSSNPRLKPWGQHVRCNASPGIRKSSLGPPPRPRKQCRRSLSMFEHPNDVLVENQPKYGGVKAPLLHTISDVEGSPSLQLPHFVPENLADSLPRIDKSVLLDLIHGKYSSQFDQVMIIDCRFEYEYEGGHINGAINFTDKEHLATQLFSPPKPRTALVLHCEYSAHRAPIMARHVRHSDRSFNADQYPALTYPDLYVLDGGYSSFFAEHRSFCFPQSYVEMNSKGNESACERGLGRVRQRTKLARSHTLPLAFTFPHQSSDVPNSPTGKCRTGKLDSLFEAGSSQQRGPTRRMLPH